MADTSVEITAGTGTQIDTRTEGTNGNHRQVVVLGDPATNAGVAPVDATAGLKVDLGADNDVTVTGTVDLGATDNAVLDVIAGDTTSLDSKVTACNTGAVVISSGTVTANLGATDNAVLDQIELNQDSQTALITAIDADTSAIATDIAALEVLQTTIAGDTTSIDSKITACNTGAIAGTVTANLSATDNAVLDTIDAVLDTIKTDTAALVVDAAASEALLTTIDADTSAMAVDLAALEVLATSIDSDTDAIKTAVETLDNAISGTEMQVDVVGSLPAGTNAIGKLAANSGVDIGDVDVLSLPALAGSIGNGAKVVMNAGTAEALAGSTACKKVIICAKDSNTGKIYYGGASVSATSGAFIYPGASVEIDISNLSAVYIDSAVNGEGVQYTYVA